YWFWGDTSGLSQTNFAVSGATSKWPGKGGLDPSLGVDLTYFTNESGFSKEMCPIPGVGPKWLFGLMTVTDEKGVERLIAKYESPVKNPDGTEQRGLVIFNDQTNTFELLNRFDAEVKLYPDGRPLRVSIDGAEYYYFSKPYGRLRVRVKADWKHITNPRAYEAFTCLVAGTRYDKSATKLDRGPDGRLIWDWKADTQPLDLDQEKELIAAGKMKPEEGGLELQNIDTGGQAGGAVA